MSCVFTDPFSTQFSDQENAVLYQSANAGAIPPAADTIRVMTWNIRYGTARIPLFYDGYGDRHTLTEGEITGNLNNISAKIREIDPDIVLLQEVDVQSKRTQYMDEVQFILDHTDLQYGAYASIWKADFIPSDGLGRINMGNAILSKWPLRDAVRIALPIRTDQSNLEKYFWFHRNILKVQIEMPGAADFYVLNIHAEAWGADGTKKRQIDIYKAELDKIKNSGEIFIAGGDFNIIPPGSPQWKDFPDIPPTARFGGDDYTGQETWMNDFYGSFESAVSLTEFQANPAPFYSFTGDANGFWNRTLDYLFTNAGWITGQSKVLQDSLLPDGATGLPTTPLSDHAPVFAKAKVSP